MRGRGRRTDSPRCFGRVSLAGRRTLAGKSAPGKVRFRVKPDDKKGMIKSILRRKHLEYFFDWLLSRLELCKLHKNKRENSTSKYGIGSTNHIDFREGMI